MYCTLGGCPFENDEVWNITWPATNASITARQKCPGNSEATGKMHFVAMYFYEVIYHTSIV